MTKYELMAEAIGIYEQLHNSNIKISNSKNVMLCRRLHLIEEELDEELNYNICKDYFKVSMK